MECYYRMILNTEFETYLKDRIVASARSHGAAGHSNDPIQGPSVLFNTDLSAYEEPME